MQADTRPEGCTNFKLRQLSRIVGRHYDEYLAASGLKGSQYSLLSHIVVHGPMRPTDLADRMQLDNSTLTRTLTTLERQGWIRRRAGADGRSRAIEATQAGARKRREAQHCWEKAQQALNARLGETEVAQLHGLLDDFGAVLGRSEPGRAESD